MDKISRIIMSLENSFLILFLCDNINEKMYKEMIARLRSIVKELKRFKYKPAEDGITFSQMEKFVNSHINFADSKTLMAELQRRGVTKENLLEIESIISKL